MGGFTSRSMRGKYELFKQRAKELLIAVVLLSVIVAALVWVLYYLREG